LAQYGRTEVFSTFYCYQSLVFVLTVFFIRLQFFATLLFLQAGFVVKIKILIFNLVQHSADIASIPVLTPMHFVNCNAAAAHVSTIALGIYSV